MHSWKGIIHNRLGRVSGAFVLVSRLCSFREPPPFRVVPFDPSGFGAIHRPSEDILQYLQQRQYKYPATLRTLQSPTTKEFWGIFIFLINDVIDSNFQWGRAGRKIEDDVILLLRDHRYRAVDSISKSSLTALGTMHTWPAVLAMLHWLVNLSLTEKLQRGLRDMQTRIHEATRANNSSEVSLSHRLHHLDSAITEYNKILWRLGLHRRKQGGDADDSMDKSKDDAEDPEGEFEVELNPAANAVGDMLRGGGALDGGLRSRVQPALNAFAAEAQEARAELESEQLAKDSEVDMVKEEIERIGDATEGLRRKIEIMQDKAEEIKRNSALVAGELREEIVRLDQEVASMGAGAQSTLVNTQARLSAVENE
ncbi:kinetochore-associated Ndc80 complex subunit ndc80 [Ceratobasidium sp. 392]|nr:kinetochore-associated Ndc80 complex subunit ndc80 [Ceratobasidium sp. 392]